MAEKILTELSIRTYQHTDMEDIIYVWEECGFIRSWKNLKLDIERKINTQKDLFFFSKLSNKIISTAMFSYYGHRGWLNYFTVALKEVKRLCKEFGFTADMLKGALAKGRSEK